MPTITVDQSTPALQMALVPVGFEAQRLWRRASTLSAVRGLYHDMMPADDSGILIGHWSGGYANSSSGEQTWALNDFAPTSMGSGRVWSDSSTTRIGLDGRFAKLDALNALGGAQTKYVLVLFDHPQAMIAGDTRTSGWINPWPAATQWDSGEAGALVTEVLNRFSGKIKAVSYGQELKGFSSRTSTAELDAFAAGYVAFKLYMEANHPTIEVWYPHLNFYASDSEGTRNTNFDAVLAGGTSLTTNDETILTRLLSQVPAARKPHRFTYDISIIDYNGTTWRASGYDNIKTKVKIEKELARIINARTLSAWGATVPLVAIESYFDVNQLLQDWATQGQQAALQTAMAMHAAMGGTTYHARWEPEGAVPGSEAPDGIIGSWWHRDGYAVAAYTQMKALKDSFPPGTNLYSWTTDDADIVALAGGTKIMLLNLNSTTAKSVAVVGTNGATGAVSVPALGYIVQDLPTAGFDYSFQDTFTRTAATGWGTATLGGAWTTNNDANYSVNGSRGLCSAGANNTRRGWAATMATILNQTVQATFSLDKIPSGGNVELYLCDREQSLENSMYMAKVVITPAGVVQLGIAYKTSAGAQGDVVAAATVARETFVANTDFTIEISATGTSPTSLEARVWRTANGRPATADASGSNSLAEVQTAGRAGMRYFVASGVTNGPVVASFDNIVSWDNTTTAPAITSAATAAFTVGAAGSFTVVATGNPDPALSRTGALPTGVSFVDNGDGTATISGTPAAASGGTYPITITADNNISPDATQNFVLTVNQAPAITSANNDTHKVGTADSFTVTTTGFPDPAISITAGSLPTGVTLVDNEDGTATISGTPAAGTGGQYVVTISATNGVGSTATQTFTLTVQEAPSITSASSDTFLRGSADSFTVTTGTCYPTSPTLSRTGTLPAGVTFTNNGNGTATIAGTPTQSGVFTITITANNGITPNAQQTFTLTVNEAPSITSADADTFQTGVADSFGVTTSAYPAPTITVLSGSLPSGVTLTDHGNGTASLAGTPAAGTGGVWPFTIRASNGVGSPADQSFTLTVNQPGSISSANGDTFQVGVADSFGVTTAGYPAPAIDISSGSLPSGVTLVDNGNGTATIAGTPGAGTGGQTVVTLRASNGIGSPGTQVFTLTVNQAPTVTSSATKTFQVGVAGSHTFTTAGYPTNPSLGRTGSLPSGVTYTDNGNGTATLAGTPAGGTQGNYPLTITANNGVSPNGTQNFTLTVDPAPGSGVNRIRRRLLLGL